MTAHDITQRIKSMQRRLGLRDDGIIGPATLTAIERLLPPPAETVHKLQCSKNGLAKLIEFEIGSSQYYNRFLKSPVWPGGASGVTLGIGYDLGYNNAAQIRKDWQGKVADRELDKLIACTGLKAEAAKQALRKTQTISIPLEMAETVFYHATLPRYANDTRKTYPGVELLPADAQSALLSLIYNRGTRLSGNHRKEMKALQARVQNKDLSGIAAQIRAMKRLWENQNLDGLLKRRDAEAQLVENAERVYMEAELIYL